jgi:hypothetical protein
MSLNWNSRSAVQAKVNTRRFDVLLKGETIDSVALKSHGITEIDKA